jgi:hypothetical protein
MNETHKESKIELCEQIHRWPTPQSKTWTGTFLSLAKKDKNIVAVVAVGSAVRPSVQSIDLDLVVICREASKMNAKPPIEIDLRAYTASRVDELIRSAWLDSQVWPRALSTRPLLGCGSKNMA